MISNQVLDKALSNGYNDDRVNNLLSIGLLLSQAQLHYNQELREYLAQYNLGFGNINKQLGVIDKKTMEISNEILPGAQKTDENKLAFFEDFDSFIKVIDNFRIDENDEYIKIACKMFNIEKSDLIGIKRTKAISSCRRCLVFFFVKYRGLSQRKAALAINKSDGFAGKSMSKVLACRDNDRFLYTKTNSFILKVMGRSENSDIDAINNILKPL